MRIASHRVWGMFVGAALLGCGTTEEAPKATDSGPDVTIGFNSKYLTDALSALTSEEVALELSGELDPGMIKPVGRDDYLGVIMPMRI